jgi:hypothetical protein
MKFFSVILRVSALFLGLSVYAVAQQQDWKTVVNSKLNGYALTTVSSDRSSVLTPGTKFILGHCCPGKNGLSYIKSLIA